jgi:hypothetical protein
LNPSYRWAVCCKAFLLPASLQPLQRRRLRALPLSPFELLN